jgi:uncharacterized secreted protein with C-terminal beta-propeller domain
MKKITKNIFFLALILVFASPQAVGAVSLGERLSGRILLQVESKGEAWYVNPKNKNRYYLGRAEDAYALMRQLGIGISNADLAKIPVGDIGLLIGLDTDQDGLADALENSLGTDINKADSDSDGFDDKTELAGGYNPLGTGRFNINTTFAKTQAGKIFLQVEKKGEAWYVNPVDGKRYFLGKPEDAFQIMRRLGLGITNKNLNTIDSVSTNVVSSSSFAYRKFASAEEFQNFIKKAKENSSYSRGVALSAPTASVSNDLKAETGLTFSSDTSGASNETVNRYSETNVQVAGIDEPDIIKTDGNNLYYSYFNNYRYFFNVPTVAMSDGIAVEKMMPSPSAVSYKTDIIKALPASAMALSAEIDKAGQLLLYKNILIIFTSDQKFIYGYDITNNARPEKKWMLELEDNVYTKEARLKDGKIYLVAGKYFYGASPCPIKILGENRLTVNCQDIYYPNNYTNADQTYSIMEIAADSGQIDRSTTFVASNDKSTIYMSSNAIYLAYSYDIDFAKLYYGFMSENPDIFPASLIEDVKKIMSYDISSYSKQYEIGNKVGSYLMSLSKEEQDRVSTEIYNRGEKYQNDHKRELNQTGITKLKLNDLSITANGSVPGYLLNQFSLDEYGGFLRTAVSVGDSSSNRANDVYVLDGNLSVVGSIKDLGETERIYSARFVEDKGYLVTFRQVDPFYVLDLSNPYAPMKKGELKIPGYSSYLHPINKNRILGIGEEDGQVKISLFDVSNPSDPKELDKYNLEDYWSAISSTHHAFLMDTKHQIFFVPGSNGGYVFSYAGDKLSLKLAVKDTGIERAVYVNDYLYLAGAKKITVYNELSWEKVGELELK